MDHGKVLGDRTALWVLALLKEHNPIINKAVKASYYQPPHDDDDDKNDREIMIATGGAMTMSL